MRLYLSSYRLGSRPEELLDLLGNGRRTAQIGNALDGEDEAIRVESIRQDTVRLRNIGLQPEELDLRKYFGRPDVLKKALADFDLIWVRGGNAFVLRRAFRQSGADVVIPDRLRQDAIAYAGASAGAVNMGPHLHGIELVDPADEVPAGYGKDIVWEGLGVFPYSIVPHYKSDHPESSAIGKTVDYLIEHHMPFIALHDGEAIVVNGNRPRFITQTLSENRAYLQISYDKIQSNDKK